MSSSTLLLISLCIGLSVVRGCQPTPLEEDHLVARSTPPSTTTRKARIANSSSSSAPSSSTKPARSSATPSPKVKNSTSTTTTTTTTTSTTTTTTTTPEYCEYDFSVSKKLYIGSKNTLKSEEGQPMFQKACECPNGAVYSFPKYNYKEDKDFDELKMDGHVARFKCREDKYCVCTSDSCYNAQDADGINIVSVCVDGRCDLKIVLEGSTAQLMPQDNKLKTYKTKDQNIDAFNTHKLSSEHYLGGVSSVVCKSCSSTSPPPKDTCSLSR